MLPSPNQHVIFKELSEGAVLFHTVEEVYFGLNEVGTRVWELLPPVSTTFDELCARVHEHYPSESLDTIRADVGELLEQLAEHDLLDTPSTAVEPRADRLPTP